VSRPVILAQKPTPAPAPPPALEVPARPPQPPSSRPVGRPETTRPPVPKAVARAPARAFRLPDGTSGHLLTMVGALFFVAGSTLLPWQHFALARLDLSAIEVHAGAIVATAVGAMTLLASLWGLVTGQRARAARVNLSLAIVLGVWLLVAAAEMRWGARLMAYESVGLDGGYGVAVIGVVAILLGAVAALGALPRWDATTSFLRLRVTRAGRPLQEIVVYEPRIVDLTAEAHHPELLADPTLLEALPRFRVTREGDTSVALLDPSSRVLLERGELDSLGFLNRSRRGPAGLRWTALRVGDSGSVAVGDAAVQFVFVKPIAGRANVRLTTFTESAALGLFVALLFLMGGVSSILMWTEDPERPTITRDRRAPRIEAVLAEDRPKEELVREVQVELATPQAPEPEVAMPEERYGDDERVAEVQEMKRTPQRAVERPTAASQDKSTDAAKDELMRRLLTPTEGSGAKLASVSVTATEPGGTLGVKGVLDALPGEMPGFASDGKAEGPTGPLAGNAADQIAKKLTAPPKPAGQVRGKVTGMKSSTKVTGSLDPGQVYSVIDGAIGRIQSCYENRLQVDPSLAGRITFRWTVTPSGSVTGVSQTVSTITDAKVAACIKGVLEKLRFPKPAGGSVEISYPFIFRSS